MNDRMLDYDTTITIIKMAGGSRYAITPLLEAQDTKSVKAVIEEIEKIAGRNDYSGESGAYELWVSGAVWEQFKSELGVE